MTVSRPSDSRQPSVLLIDYDSAVLKALPELMTRSVPSLRIDPCSSRDHAEQRLRLKRYQGVISNALLASMGGFSLLHATRSLQPQASFIVTTGPPEAELASQAIEKGSLDVIVTPPDPRPIETTLRVALWLFKLKTAIRYREEALSWIHGQREALSHDGRNRAEMVRMLERGAASYEQTIRAIETSYRLLLGTAARLEEASRLRATATLRSFDRRGRGPQV
jgi:DNA-binding NtrC family response regulator